ncbi:MAG: hypothetical protein NXI07_13755, partial [bacterium]|nr:hypothetical protein [bacterium]
MSASTTATTTTGKAIFNDPGIGSSIDALVEQVMEHNRTITDVKAPNPELAESFEAIIERCKAVKGNNLVYPSIGSGAG